MQTWVNFAGIVGGLAAAVAVIGTAWAVLRGIWRLIRRMGAFLDDWMGEDERPGVPARPGVMERLTSIEREVTYNSGGSLKDAVARIEDRVTAVEQRR